MGSAIVSRLIGFDVEGGVSGVGGVKSGEFIGERLW